MRLLSRWAFWWDGFVSLGPAASKRRGDGLRCEDEEDSPYASGPDDDLLGRILSSISVTSPEELARTVAAVLSMGVELASVFLGAANGTLEVSVNL